MDRLLALAVFFLVAACGRIDPVAELAAARADLAAGDLRAASIRLSNVIVADPENAEARTLRGELALAVGDYGRAVAELEQAQALGETRERVAIPLAEAAARTGRLERARTLLDDVMPSLQDDVRYWVARAEVAIFGGAAEEAAEALDRAAALGAADARYSVARGRLALLQNDPQRAEDLFTAATGHDPADGEAYVALGELYARTDRLALASDALERAAGLFEAQGRTFLQSRVLLALLQIHLAGNDLEAASAVADRLAEAIPQGAVSFYARGLVEYRRGNFAAAAANLQDALNAAPDNAQFLTLLAATQLAQGNLGQAEQHLLRVLARDARDPAAVKLLAETRLRQQRPDAALEALQPLVDSVSQDAQIGLLTGLANLLVGNAEQAIVYLEQAAALDPGNQLVKIQLAKAYSAIGRHSEAARVLNATLDAGDQRGNLEAHLLRLLAYARAGDAAGGEQAVRDLLEEQAGEPIAYVAAAVYREAVNQPRAARELLEKAVELDDQSVPARLLLAGALLQEGRTEDAEQNLRRVLAIDPANVQALVALAQVVASRNALDEAEELLGRATAASPAVLPRLMLTQLYLLQGRVTKAGEPLAQAAEAAPNDPQVIAMRGMLALAEGRAEEAVSLLADAESRLPFRLDVVLALAEARVRSGAPDEARATLRRALGTVPQSLPLRAALGAVELRLGNSDEALAIAKALQTEFPRRRHGYQLEAQVEVARRRYDSAAAAFRVAYEQEPVWPVVSELVGALRLANRSDEALKVLGDWVSKEPADVRARLAFATLLEATSRTEEAIRQLEAVLEIDEQNVVALNNGAWLYHQVGDPRALSLAERAHALAPDNAAVLDTLGSILLAQDREQDAIAYLEKAAQLAPQALEIRYHLAEAQVALGRTAEARATLESLLRAGVPFDQRADAQALLDTL